MKAIKRSLTNKSRDIELAPQQPEPSQPPIANNNNNMTTPRSTEAILQSKKRDVIIIGAGLSEPRKIQISQSIFANLRRPTTVAISTEPAKGLSAARELRSHGLDVLVLEARGRVGGRTHTKVGADGKFWVDLGGSYVGPTQDSILNLIDELKLETYLVEDAQDTGYLRTVRSERPQGSRVELRGRMRPGHDIPLANPLAWLDYVNMIRLIDRLGEQIPSEAPWLAPRAREWDNKSYRQFVEENTYTRRARDFFNNVHAIVDVCVEPQEASMLWLLWYIKQCGGFGRTIATTNGGQERKVKGGTEQVSQRLQELVGRQRVLLNKPVSKLDQSQGPFVVVTCTDGSQFRADQLVCAFPPHLMLKIHHEPPLPSGKNLLAQRSPMGTVAKIILYYEREFWKDHNYSGCFIFDAADRRAQPVILTLNETKPDGTHPAVIGFLAADGWLATRDMSTDELARLVARSYAQATQLEEFLKFSRVERMDWTEEQYSGGCYTTIHSLNTLVRFGHHLRQPFGRIHYAGTETATKWSGYMDGAVSAGKRAAREVLHVRGLIEESQVWREEAESVSVPPRPFEYPASHRFAPSIAKLIRSAQLVGAVALIAFLVSRARHSGNKW